MSTMFSFSRLGKLIAKQFFENARLYLFSVLALLGQLALVFTLWLTAGGSNYAEESTYVIFSVGLFIAGAIFASISFNMIGSKDKGLYWLSVPATHFEKLICTIFYTTIVFTVVYCLCFLIVQSISLSFLKSYIEQHPGTSFREVDESAAEFKMVAKYIFLVFFAVQSLYLLGSIYFARYSFIVTTVVCSAIIFAFVYWISKVQAMLPGNWEGVFLETHENRSDLTYKVYSLPTALTNTLKYLVQYAWAPIFWLVTWFRLKEKEI